MDPAIIDYNQLTGPYIGDSVSTDYPYANGYIEIEIETTT